MSNQKSKQKILTPSKGAITTRTTSFNTDHPRCHNVQNFLLIWIDTSINQSTKYSQNILTQLRSVINDIHIFAQLDECVDFLTEVEDMKAFLIVEGTTGQQILPLIQDVPQLDGIYIFCENTFQYESWAKKWTKIRGVYTEMIHIYEALKMDVKQCNQDLIAMNFVMMNEGVSIQNLHRLEPSFMYIQILKEILFEMEHDKQSIKDFANYCRKFYDGNMHELNIINEFERSYRPNLSIWWYTRECFTYHMLNRALRTLDTDIIINMAFFIHDLHNQIEQLHQQQVSNYNGKSFIVYRGQGLSTADFEKLRQTKGGLISFNNFLSTSKKREASLQFAKDALTKTDMTGILFRMFINPSASSVRFSDIQEVSYFHVKEEILFSMHTIFRIGLITPIDNNKPLYQVELKLTSDDDQELRTLIKHIRQEAGDSTGWNRLGNLLLNIGQFEKSEKFYKVLLEQTSNENEKAIYYSQLGYLRNRQGNFQRAIWYHEKSLEILEKILPTNHFSLAASYNNIGLVYDNMGEYSKAFLFYKKSLKIRQKTLTPNHLSLATSYNNIGSVYQNVGEYSKALLFYKKALNIKEKNLASNHPSLATSYNNIGGVYNEMGEYSRALSFYEKDLDMCQKMLPSNHNLLAISYNNIGLVYMNMREHWKALSSYEKALDIKEKILCQNHPSLAISYNNIGRIYNNMGKYSEALSFYEKTREIFEKILPRNNSDLATSYNNIAGVYYNMENYSKALLFYDKTREIFEKTSSTNHSNLAATYNNIGGVYQNMKIYSKALSSYEKSLEIKQKMYPENHLSLATSYNNIACLHYNMKTYSKALLYFERTLNIRERLLPSNHSDLEDIRESIKIVKTKL